MIKILLVGCNGKMGHMVSSVAEASDNLIIEAGIDMKTYSDFGYPVYNNISDVKENIDVILDFSRPSSLESITIFALEKKIPIVLCTTGYSEKQTEYIRSLQHQIPVFFSANMSIGINIINNVLKSISEKLYEDFDIEIIEKHHNQKVDAPSGTALLLANTIKDSIASETTFVKGRDGIAKRNHNEIGIHAIRGGSIVGEHEVIFAGQGEIIEIKHTAMSREVFALGAVKACRFICNKPNGLYSMDDVVK